MQEGNRDGGREKERQRGGSTTTPTPTPTPIVVAATVAAVNYVFRVNYRETCRLLSIVLLFECTNVIFWSRHGNTTLSLPAESRQNLKLLCERIALTDPAKYLPSRATRGPFCANRAVMHSGNAIFGPLPDFTVESCLGRLTTDGGRCFLHRHTGKDERFVERDIGAQMNEMEQGITGESQ